MLLAFGAGGNFVGLVEKEWDGVSVRIYDKEENNILQRDRTDFEIEEIGFYFSPYYYYAGFGHFGFNVSARETRYAALTCKFNSTSCSQI